MLEKRKKRQQTNRLVLRFLWLPHWRGPCAKRNNADSNDSPASKDEGYFTNSPCSATSRWIVPSPTRLSSLPVARHRGTDHFTTERKRRINCQHPFVDDQFAGDGQNGRHWSVRRPRQPSRNLIAPFSCKRRIPAPNWKNWMKEETSDEAIKETPSSAHHVASPSYNSNKRGPLFHPSVTMFSPNSKCFIFQNADWFGAQLGCEDWSPSSLATDSENGTAPDTTQLLLSGRTGLVKKIKEYNLRIFTNNN